MQNEVVDETDNEAEVQTRGIDDENAKGQVSSHPDASNAKDQSTNNGLGMALVFLSTLCFAVGNALVSIIGLQIPVMQIIFIRGTSQLVLALILIAVMSGSKRYTAATWIGAPQNRMLLFSRAVWGVGALITLFAAFQVCPTFPLLHSS